MTTAPLDIADAGRSRPGDPSTGAGARRGALAVAGGLLVVLTVAAWLRTRHLADVGTWSDESFCLKMVEFSWGEMLGRIGQDTHPPLFYLLLKAWQYVFGPSPAAARWLSVICGLGAVAGTYAFVREAYWRDGADSHENFRTARLPALVAAALVALSPIHVFWSMQIRGYALGTALAAWSSYFLMRALRRTPPRTRDWCGFTFTAALLAHTHYFALFVVAAEYLFAFGVLLTRPGGRRVERFQPVLLSTVGIWLLSQPWLPSFLVQRARVAQSFWPADPSWDMLGKTAFELFALYERHSESVTLGLGIAQALFVVLLGVLVGRRLGDVYLVLASVLPFAAAFAVSSMSQSLLVPRYFLFAHLFLVTAIGVLVCRVPWLSLRAVTVLLTLGGMSVLTARYMALRNERAQLPGMRAATARIDAVRKPGELLLVCNPMLYTSVLPYIRNRTGIVVYRAGGGFPYFQGTAVLRDNEYFSPEQLDAANPRYVWTLDADRSRSLGKVRLPRDWVPVDEVHFREWYCEMILRLYTRETAGQATETKP